ncbi:tripartite tricarboxylate transporter TctB family protein [uncultured Oscillibacter sp.]|uniref:tripartite tricarboxylate transporter TctB family protein n=1 Tax=uncultured Oscillibacter sp. TaxID=876091 RepID=UPI0028046061|nr:tripartite tricarboxylate transporter TctB family protein [uncultured Oscillibacter sp.]
MKWRKTTLPDGIGLLGFAAFLAVGAARVSMKNWNGVGISPRAFPYFLAACVGLMGVMLVLGGLRTMRTQAGEEEGAAPPKAKPHQLFHRETNIHPSLFVVALAIVYQLLWKPVGFLLVTPVFMWILLAGFGVAPKKAAVMTAGVVGAVYLVFTFGFRVTLPPGILRGIL